MRRTSALVVAAILLLAGCGAPPTDTPMVEAPTDVPSAPTPSETLPSPATEQPAATIGPTQAVATLLPLSLQSDLETIRLRMLHSHQNWRSIWLELEVTEYPPEGSDLLVRYHRVQVWVRQPAELLLLRGPADGDPDYFSVSDGTHFLEADLSTGATQEGEITPYALEPFVAPEAITDTISGHPLEGMIRYPGGEMVFPTGLAQRQGTFELIGEDAVAGRDALIVDWAPQPTGLIADRFRIDALTGVLLRHQVLGKTGGGERVESDLAVTHIVFDPEFPSGLFSVGLPETLHFAAPLDAE